MKRLILAILLVLLMPAMAFSAGTLTLSSTTYVPPIAKILTITGVADAANGTWPALAIDADALDLSASFLSKSRLTLVT
jgi:hypothetical protein